MIVLKPLVHVLESMLSTHETLLELAKRKKRVLIQNDMSELNAIVKEEVTLAHQVEKLEGERSGMVRLLSLRLGLPAEELTARKVAALAGTPEERETIAQLNDQLLAVMTQLKEQNELNKQLIEQSLDFIRNSIDLLTESPIVPTYGDSGDTHAAYTTTRTSFFDSKA